MVEEYVSFFRRCLEHLAPIPDDEWNQVKDKIQYREFKKGEVFSREGEVATNAVFILEGIFRLYYVSDKGEEFTRTLGHENMVLGDYNSLLTKLPSRCTMETVTASKALTFNYSVLTDRYSKHSCWESIGRRIAEQRYLEKENREYQLLMLSATERYEKFLEEYGELEQRIPDKLIASFLGITPVSLSRIRKNR